MGFRKNLKKGEVVFRENDPSDCAYIVGVGAIEICKKTPRGQKVLKVLGDNEIFGEMGLIDGLPRSATARARQDSVVYILTSKNFENLANLVIFDGKSQILKILIFLRLQETISR